MAKLSKLGTLTHRKTKDQFSEELAKYTSLTAGENKALFPKQKDREEMVHLLKIVNKAGDDTAKKAELIENIGKVGGAVLKVAKRFAIGL